MVSVATKPQPLTEPMVEIALEVAPKGTAENGLDESPSAWSAVAMMPVLSRSV